MINSLRNLCIILFFSSIGFTASADAFRFEFTDKAFQAYEYAISLQFEESRNLLLEIKAEDPKNLIVHHIENYIDFFTIFINEDKADFERLRNNKKNRLKQIRKGSNKSPYYLYAQAEIHLQWALARLKFEEYFTAFNEVSKAYRLLQENQYRYPSFIANKKSLGVLHAIVGTIPDKYKWGIKLIGGLDGTIEQGCGEIEEVLAYANKNDFIFEEETRVIYALLLLHLKNEREEAWNYINNAKLNPDKNPLASFILANIAMKTGRNNEAIELLENRPMGNGYQDFHYLDFMLGKAKLNRLDEDADVYFQKFLSNSKGKNYIKESYQKLAWCALLKEDSEAYAKWIQEVERNGGAQIDEDKQALKELELGLKPNIDLLKARLLFDGGYYTEALDILKDKYATNYDSEKNRIEHDYRLGRILHKMNSFEKALESYQRTIDRGAELPFYFACNAALQSGLIYEKLKDYPKAEQYFKYCRRLKPEEYKTSLHQKAKSGLQRLPKGK